jgi:tRNA(fMet)-specific endonuclease VapC
MMVLDTDIANIVQGPDNPVRMRLLARLGGFDDEDIRLSVVTYHEQFRGWAAALAAAGRDELRLVRLYSRLATFHEAYRDEALLPYDGLAAAEFNRLRAAKVRIGTMDLRIASIALAAGATLVTRNLRDFRQVPGLQAEDWSAEPDADGARGQPRN